MEMRFTADPCPGRSYKQSWSSDYTAWHQHHLLIRTSSSLALTYQTPDTSHLTGSTNGIYHLTQTSSKLFSL